MSDEKKTPAWRQDMGDLQRHLGRVAEWLDREAEGSTVGGYTLPDVVRRAAHLLNSAEANVRKEERLAWDQYAASGSGNAIATATDDYSSAKRAARHADELMVERRTRFARKEDA